MNLLHSSFIPSDSDCIPLSTDRTSKVLVLIPSDCLCWSMSCRRLVTVVPSARYKSIFMLRYIVFCSLLMSCIL